MKDNPIFFFKLGIQYLTGYVQGLFILETRFKNDDPEFVFCFVLFF